MKHFKFDDRVSEDVLKSVCQGEAFQIVYGTNVKGGPIAFQFLLDKLSGVQFRYATFDKAAAEKTRRKGLRRSSLRVLFRHRSRDARPLGKGIPGERRHVSVKKS